ncbi:type II toxin-antitoxin system VapC family toxin [Bifidobacterium canis]|uniref:Toxin-antitoxin system toxin component PIN family n=1 Tax=Bifidobacterium canis TaxID=2610880 RepID=A0A7K1J5D5_9BIFI|nr:PIN domain-containing protein [Bifidobacterium canis]MUH59802.1 toxin-antitoxin system toxin component PIN family [Bifidobacterium canis]
MQVLLDTNVLLDFCDSARQPFHDDCLTLLRACVNNDVATLASVSSLNDAYYILAKRYGEPFAQQSVAGLLELFDVQPMLVSYANTAVDSNEPDFEDGLIRAMAEKLHCDVIVTRDAAAFRASQVPALTPQECVARLV